MNKDQQYSNREIDMKFAEVHHRFDDQATALAAILKQTTKTNGNVRRHEKILWVVASVVATLFATNGPALVQLVQAMIK